MKRRQTRNDVARPLENGPFQTMPITVRMLRRDPICFNRSGWEIIS